MIDKDKLNQWVDQLVEDDQKTVFEYKHRHNEIEAFYNDLPEVDEPLSEEEKRQLKGNSGWMEWEEFERALSKGDQ